MKKESLNNKVPCYKIKRNDIISVYNSEIKGKPKLSSNLYINKNSQYLFTKGTEEEKCAIVNQMFGLKYNWQQIKKWSFKRKLNLVNVIKTLFMKTYNITWIKD